MSRRALVFAAAVAVQVVILAIVPAGKVWTRATGRTVFLRVEPVDPYNILSGYHVVLRYEVGQRRNYPDVLQSSPGDVVHATVKEGADGAWHPLHLSHERPTELAENEVVLRGHHGQGGRILFGIEAFFVPEAERHELAARVREDPESVRVEVRVGASGEVALVELHLPPDES